MLIPQQCDAIALSARTKKNGFLPNNVRNQPALSNHEKRSESNDLRWNDNLPLDFMEELMKYRYRRPVVEKLRSQTRAFARLAAGRSASSRKLFRLHMHALNWPRDSKAWL